MWGGGGCAWLPGPRSEGAGEGAHPVHDEDLADVEPLLELLGGDGHRVEETEAPVWRSSERERDSRTCSTGRLQ